MTAVLAPPAPGRLGSRIEPTEISGYLTALDQWVRDRRTELDEIDAAVLASPQGRSMTGDLTLLMALWKAVADRLRLIQATWDGGRVGPQERERISTLIWGRLDATVDRAALRASSVDDSVGLALSLPEACRLSDALVAQLKVRLALDPSADAHARRIRDIRAQLERIRDQIDLEPLANRPAAQQIWSGLSDRLTSVTERAGRGADVGGLIGPLENDAARFERDLIVFGAQRRETMDEWRAVQELVDDLEAREGALRDLATEARSAVTPLPPYAVPDVSALGPPPSTKPELAAFRARLDRVAAAMNLATDLFSQALDKRADLVVRAEGVASQNVGSALPQRICELALHVLAQRPVPLPVAEHLVLAAEASTGTSRTKERS